MKQRRVSLGLRQRGSLILGALFLFAILISLGLGVMSSQVSRMRVAQAQSQSFQARGLALAGWEDLRVKLGKDILFPPLGDDQPFFSYSEDVYDSEGEYYGSYTVILDSRFRAVVRDRPLIEQDSEFYPEVGFYLVTCVGRVGPRAGHPDAERTITFEIDMRPGNQPFRIIRIEDHGSL